MKSVWKNAASCWLLVILFVAGALLLPGQSDVGNITGLIRDQTGAVVPNAKITITNEATGEEHTVQSDTSGNYTVTNLQPGSYKMTASAPGFQNIREQQQPAERQLDYQSRRAISARRDY